MTGSDSIISLIKLMKISFMLSLGAVILIPGIGPGVGPKPEARAPKREVVSLDIESTKSYLIVSLGPIDSI